MSANLRVQLCHLPFNPTTEQVVMDQLRRRISIQPDLVSKAEALLYDGDPRVAGLALSLFLGAKGKLSRPLLPFQVHRFHLEGMDDVLFEALKPEEQQALRQRIAKEGPVSTGQALEQLASRDFAGAARTAVRALMREQEGANGSLLGATGDFLRRRFNDSPPEFVGPLLDGLAAAGALPALRAWRAVFDTLRLEQPIGAPAWKVGAVDRWPSEVQKVYKLMWRHFMPVLQPELRKAAPKVRALLELEPLGAFEFVQAFRWVRPQICGVSAACIEQMAVSSGDWHASWKRFLGHLNGWSQTGRFWPACEVRLKLYRGQLSSRRNINNSDALARLQALETQLRQADAKNVRVKGLDFLPVLANEPRPVWWLIIKGLGLQPAEVRRLLG
ncbi:MAG: hypothetical protein HN348_05130 [Proteobacteria bacterium]|jgi:hypothetical protein|nr:hypothetical protein [Pseudomonadota bacterium]